MRAGGCGVSSHLFCSKNKPGDLPRSPPPGDDAQSLQTGLPDFSWYNIPKQENKLPLNLPNGRKINQIDVT
jgi:hypothetical protein